jgi:hypothetical protein
MAEKGTTSGKVINTAVGSRVYFKPALGKVVLRKPGVTRSSDAVIAVNKILEDLRAKARELEEAGKKEEAEKLLPAKKCAGKPWKQFTKCLREEMKKIVTKDKVTEELKKMYEEAKKANDKKTMEAIARKLKARGVAVS